MTSLELSEIPEMIGIYYSPDQDIDDIDVGEREFCLELLKDAGFRCVSGAIGVGSHNFTVSLLDREARRDSLIVASSNNPEELFAGPNPIMEGGVGVWAAA